MINLKYRIDFYTLERMSTPSSTPTENLVETELLRKRIYETEFISWAVKEIPEMKYKEVCHLLLRYLFNKIITKTEDDDPVFIETRSPLAEEQLKKDLVYHKISRDPQKIIDELEKRFSLASTQMDGEIKSSGEDKSSLVPTFVNKDRDVSLTGGKIVYGTHKYEDISNLAKKYPRAIKYALSLNIRYNYLKLANHGLARVYKEMANPSEGCEAFGSAFNHYFDRFCSAFPDLEHPFGSMGSFFDMKEWMTNKVYMNPPFDESLMTCAIDRVMEYCKQSKEDIEFLCTFPKWDAFPGIDRFRECEWMRKVNVYEKGEIPFIDYMNSERIIYPCGIVEVIVGSKKKKSKKEVEIVFEEDEEILEEGDEIVEF